MTQIKNSLFYIGIIIFSLTMFFEQLCIGETSATCFIKGFACGLEIVGAIVLVLDKKKSKKE